MRAVLLRLVEDAHYVFLALDVVHIDEEALAVVECWAVHWSYVRIPDCDSNPINRFRVGVARATTSGRASLN